MTTTCELEEESEIVSPKIEFGTKENHNNVTNELNKNDIKSIKKTKKSKKRKSDNNITNDDSPKPKRKQNITTNGLSSLSSNGDENNFKEQAEEEVNLENNQIDDDDDDDDDNNNKTENDEAESKSVKKKEKPDKENEEEEETENLLKITDKEASRITGKSLRSSFNNPTEGLTVVKKFVAICNDKKKLDLAAQYLNAGGSVLEILKLLDMGDKKSLGNATAVFAAVEIVIMKILEKYPQYNSSATEECRHLLNSHLSSIHSMLSSQSNAKQRKVVLRLLTAVVSLGGNLPRELLGHLSLHSQVLETLSKHTDPSDSQSVRTSFVHFILSFLIEGNLSVIRTLLDKRGVISSIFPGLIYDSYNLVNLVLTTIKSYVLENQGISKTIKLHTFSTPVVQNLVSLYNWKGPKNWPVKNRKKQQADSHSGSTDPEEKRIVVDVLHEFLLTLLTSNKFGIIFHDRLLGTSGQRNNQLADTILQSLDRPWEHEKPSDLVVKILVACPDLIKPQILYTESYLEPSASSKWILLMEFMQQIVGSQDPETCFKPCLSELTTPQLFSALTNLTVNSTVLKKGINLSINNDNSAIRHSSIALLKVMLKQLKRFLITLKKSLKDASEIQKIDNMVSDYVLKNVPTLDSVLIAWKKTLESEKEIAGDESCDKTSETIPFPSRKESLTAILDLLLIYRDVCPQILETSFVSIDSTTLLTGLNTSNDIEEEELANMKVKALQFLLALDSSVFESKKELFAEVIPFLISLVDSSQEFGAVNFQARNAIKTIFYNCGVFEGCDYQIDIWISSILDFDEKGERIELGNWLVKMTRETVKHMDKYIGMINNAEDDTAGEEIYSKTTIDDILTELMERDMSIERNKSARLLPWVSISPLLASGLVNAKKNKKNLILSYLSRVTVHTLHCQMAPKTLINLLKDFGESPSTFYVSSWIFDGEHCHTKKLLSPKSVITRLSKALVSNGNSKIDLSEIFQGERKLSFKIDDREYKIEHSMNSDDVLQSFKLTLFYFTRLVQEREENFDDQLYLNVKLIVAGLLNVAKDIEDRFYEEDLSLNISKNCCDWILSNPVLLQHFSPLYCYNEKKSIAEKYSTELISSVLLTAVDLFGENKISDVVIPFKDKFITKILTAVKKRERDYHSKVKEDDSEHQSVVRFVQILQFDITDIIEILNSLVELSSEKLISDKNLSIWGILVPKLLAATVNSRENFDRGGSFTVGKCLIQKIIQFMILPSISKTRNFDLWIHSLLEHLKRFPHNIAAIDKNFFLSLFKGKINPSTIELTSFLINRNPKFISTYVKYSLKNIEALKNKEFVFSMLSSIENNDIQKEFLTKLHDLYKEEIHQWYSNPESVDSCIKKNVKAAVRLIESVIDSKTCDEICESILSNGDKLFTIDESYVQLLKIVFKKASESENPGENNRLVDFSQILIHVIVSSLKKESKNYEKHENLCDNLLEILNLLKNGGADDSKFHELRKNHSWAQFTRFSLKLGLKNSKENDIRHNKLLKTLIKLCKIVYEDNGDDEYVKTLFQMTTSHSEFINIMLGSSITKRDLVELLLTLVKKNNSLMLSMHVPLYLGSYTATLSETDQIILELLQYYESNNIRLTDYRPYLWGSAAASHYSVKTGSDTAIWRQPSTSQVLDLFLQEIVNNTIKDYPVRRKLKSEELYPPSKSTYDPAFYLPLLSYLLSDNSVIACHKITQSGALALALSACGSIEEDTRLAALTIISRFYYHLEGTNSKEKLLWLHFIDIFRNGVISSSNGDISGVKISCLVSTFMARTSQVATQPLNALYSPLQNFLMAKPELDLNTIPEFLQLFHSSDVDNKLHRFWILEVIRDGLKTIVDTEIAFKCLLFKMLFAFYNCVLADKQAKILILQVINSVSRIPNACILLVTGYGLLPWLDGAIYSTPELENDIEFVKICIKLLANVFQTLSQSNEKSENLFFMLLRIMMNLKDSLNSKNTDIESYKSYIVTLEKLISLKIPEFCKILTIKDINGLIKLSKNVLGDVDECEDMLKFNSSKFINNNLCIGDSNDNNHSVSIAKYHLKKLLITWYSSKKEFDK